MRILGLDVGQKTIGIAVSDPLGFTAQGITTIRRKNKNYDLEEVIKLIKKYEANIIVIGLPKNMNGSIGFAGEKIMEFTKLLEEKIQEEVENYKNIKIEMWDERLTTVAAHRAMLETDLTKSKRKKIVDKIAATYILQGFLDRLSNLKK